MESRTLEKKIGKILEVAVLLPPAIMAYRLWNPVLSQYGGYESLLWPELRAEMTIKIVVHMVHIWSQLSPTATKVRTFIILGSRISDLGQLILESILLPTRQFVHVLPSCCWEQVTESRNTTLRYDHQHSQHLFFALRKVEIQTDTGWETLVT